MNRSTLGLICCLVVVSPAAAQDLDVKAEVQATERPAITTGKASKIGAEKPAKGRYTDHGWGIKFKISSGWTAQKSADGIVLSSPKKDGFILVFPHQLTSTNELIDGASEGMIIDGKNYLRVVGEPKSFSKTGISATFGGIIDEMGKVKGYAVGVLNKLGDGAVVLAVHQEAGFDDKDKKTVETIAKSIRFSKPKSPKTVKDWKKELGSSKLEYLAFYRSSGFGGDSGSKTENNTIILCPDGTFLFRDRGHGPISAYDRGGMPPKKDDVLGLWNIESNDKNTQLVLDFDGGRVSKYLLNYDTHIMKLNKHRYYWQPTKCR